MPDIEEAKKFTSLFLYNGYNYRIVFMCRINPYKVRIADIDNNKEYWIVERDKLGDLNGIKTDILIDEIVWILIILITENSPLRFWYFINILSIIEKIPFGSFYFFVIIWF